jgi:hypothetical protein
MILLVIRRSGGEWGTAECSCDTSWPPFEALLVISDYGSNSLRAASNKLMRRSRVRHVFLGRQRLIVRTSFFERPVSRIKLSEARTPRIVPAPEWSVGLSVTSLPLECHLGIGLVLGQRASKMASAGGTNDKTPGGFVAAPCEHLVRFLLDGLR